MQNVYSMVGTAEEITTRRVVAVLERTRDVYLKEEKIVANADMAREPGRVCFVLAVVEAAKDLYSIAASSAAAQALRAIHRAVDPAAYPAADYDEDTLIAVLRDGGIPECINVVNRALAWIRVGA